MRKTLAILLSVVAIPTVSHAKLEKSMKKDCLVCHQNWLLEAKVSSPRLLTDRTLMAGDTIMCLTCHDGSMADDRLTFLNFGKHSHPVDVKVPEDMKIPKKFPLHNGRLFCGTCHTPHSEVGSQDKLDYTFMRFKNTDSSMCIDCHKNNTGHGNHPILADTAGKMSSSVIAKIESLHGRVGKDGEVTCQSCHAAHKGQGEHALITSNKDSQLCSVCHTEELNSPEHRNKMSHPVLVAVDSLGVKPSDTGLKFGDSGKVECYTCHKVHHSDEKRLLAESPKSLCVACHVSEKTILHSKHGFADKDACLECHTAHKAVGANLWGRKLNDKATAYAVYLEASDADRMCISCHYPGGEAPDMGTISHPTNVETKFRSLPLKKGRVACVTCHNPHKWSAVGAPKSDRANGSFLRVPEKDLCSRCHPGNCACKKGVHGAIDNRNVLGETPRNAGRCAACHVPHKAVGAYLKGIRGGEGLDNVSAFCMACHGEGGVARAKVMAGKFKDHPIDVRTKDGKVVTCASCHNPHSGNPYALIVPVEGDSALCLKCHKDKNLKGTAHYLVAKSESIEKNGQCSACHTPHNPKGPTLWNRELGEGKTINERQCTSCHAPGKMAASLTTGKISHPLGGKVETDAVPAINQKTGVPGEGVVDCASCHDPHGSAAGKPFLRVTNRGSKLCISCHKTEAAIKGTGHDVNGQMCSACHVPHQAKGAFLWKIELKNFTYPNGETVDRASSYCLTCHSKGGVAENATVEYFFHPRADFDIVAQDRPGRKGKWPIFAENGTEVKRAGAIACETCHDAHIHGKTYFLRNRTIAGSTCVDCHGDEALIRYMWYHKKEVRQSTSSYK
ncbi:cytochrome c3 family protein [Desulfurobacterium sp. TC5-1]|uniref:cytochrome c3 family protein n=1 Tax=Desulfurobacterium sp. TC5-1 TaxID=1158318 RepID=UPI0003B6610E|nr:cytochrome c3 family protein [Desulfurobacterium sp. TC5-1]